MPPVFIRIGKVMDSNELQKRSNEKLKSFVHKKIQKVFETTLTHLQLALKNDQSAYQELRHIILGIGNNAIRECKEEIANNYTVEFQPDKVMILYNKSYRK